MNRTLRELIPAMAGLMSVSGHETAEADALTALMRDFEGGAPDAVGNRIFVRRCGRAHAPRILIDTHFDEIGMLVTEIAEGGFLRVAAVGGLDPRTLASAEVVVYGKEALHGVLSSTPPHLRDPQKADKLPPVTELLVDTGCAEERLRKLVRVGTPVGFAPRAVWLENDRLVAKGLDNKAACAVAAWALAELPADALAGDVYLLFSSHEEIDRIGGTAPGGFGVRPDYAMVIDANFALAPGVERDAGVTFGGGPSITRSAIADRRLTAMTESLCEKNGIPWQCSVEPGHTGTNTAALHLVGEGIPVVDVGLPLRAMHTYVEMIDLADAERLAALVRAFVTDREIAEVYR